MEVGGTRKQPSYFSILIRHKGAGLTDQLYQFSSFYKLGVSLGLKYIYSPLSCERTSHDYDIYNFLGIDRYLSRFSAPGELHYRSIDFDGQDVLRSGVKSLSDLKEYTLSKIDRVNNEYSDDAFVSDSAERELVYSFRLIMGRGREFFDFIQLAMPYWPVDINMLSAYKSARDIEPVPSVFSKNRKKILVHMRQGDTALLHTPWNTFVPLFKLRLRAATEYQDAREAGAEYISTQDYCFFIKRLLAFFERDSLSVVFSSDGFDRAFSKLLRQRNIDRFEFSKQQVDRLAEARKNYDVTEFRQLEEIEGCISLIGESAENTYGFIHSIVEAEIVVIGTQQRMIPKFLSSYYDLQCPKTVITLYRGQCRPDYLALGLTPEKARCLFFNLEEDDFDEFWSQAAKSLLPES